ncbi:MAG: hypothetical protein JXJ22_11685 [Bacteroidales bacterium]|nr:hypothetical protein [Bacteroidales bacterium]
MFKPKFLSTASWSMPHTDIPKSIDLSLSKLDIPTWLQLLKFGRNEQMKIEYS